MASDMSGRREKLNKLLAGQGSFAERARMARELDDETLILAASRSPQAKEELDRRRHEQMIAGTQASTTVTFLSGEMLPLTRDGLDFSIEFSVVDSQLRGAPEEAHATTVRHIVVGISRTLESVWGLEPADRDRVLLEFAKRHIQAKIEDGTLTEREELQLTTANTPTPCPFDPRRITVEFGRPMNFLLTANNRLQATEPLSLAARIIDCRDNVNAVFHDRHGQRLLTVPQERALLELFRPCRSEEEFGYRLSALAGLAGAVNATALPQEGGDDAVKLGSIQTLRKYLVRMHGTERSSAVCDPLRHLNKLRQKYPIHTDHAEGIIEAHEFFGLEYPIRDWPHAWRVLLQRYANALESLLTVLKEK